MLKTGNTKLVSVNYSGIIEAFNCFKQTESEGFPRIFGEGNASKFICKKLFLNKK